MLGMERLSDLEHPLVQSTANSLTAGLADPQDKLRRIFHFVRDEISFGFPPEGDFVTASQTIQRGYGQCNTKAILFLTLCKAVGIPARLHFSTISKEIQHGFFMGLFYRLMPEVVTHSWLEVEISGQCHQLDSYINDLALHKAAVRELKRRGWETGFSVSAAAGEPSADFDLGNTRYSQMAAVNNDQGTWEEAAVFFNGPKYLNSVGFFRQCLYRLYLPLANWRIRKLRATA